MTRTPLSSSCRARSVDTPAQVAPGPAGLGWGWAGERWRLWAGGGDDRAPRRSRGAARGCSSCGTSPTPGGAAPVGCRHPLRSQQAGGGHGPGQADVGGRGGRRRVELAHDRDQLLHRAGVSDVGNRRRDVGRRGGRRLAGSGRDRPTAPIVRAEAGVAPGDRPSASAPAVRGSRASRRALARGALEAWGHAPGARSYVRATRDPVGDFGRGEGSRLEPVRAGAGRAAADSSASLGSDLAGGWSRPGEDQRQSP